mgnify:CR=1 FL=1
MKLEREKNQRIIAMQREQELIKNNNIKDMIRQQKMMAEERKEMVSISFIIVTINLCFRNSKKKDLCKETD